MKNKLKIGLAILTIILISLISFLGIYTKNVVGYDNIIPSYKLGRNLQGSRIVTIKVDDTVNEVKYDAQGNRIEDSDESAQERTEGEQQEYTTKEEPVNPQEILNKENYEICKKIIEDRFQGLKLSDYMIKQNKETGEIQVELPDDENSQNAISYLENTGRFEICDEETKEVLMNNDDIKLAKVMYGSTSSGTTVYLDILFNKEGTKKLEEISSTYIQTTNQVTKVDEETGEEKTEDETTKKQVKIMLDEEEILTTYFGETLKTGELQLSIGSATTDSETMQEYLKEASTLASVISSGKMPIQYKVETDEYIQTPITQERVNVAIYILIGMVALSFIYIIIKYKKLGFLSVLASIGSIALLLILIRYTNVVITIESVVAFISLIIANHYIQTVILAKVKSSETVQAGIKEACKNVVDNLVILLIIAVVFTFINWVSISSIGMIMFWGIISILISNLIFTRTFIVNCVKK